MSEANKYMHGGDHYVRMGVEPWNVIDSWPLEQRIGFYRGSAIKYLMRLGNKDASLQEVQKAKHYCEKLIEVLNEPVQPAPQSEADSLREEIEMLRSHINNGIEKTCGFFCALPECPRAQQKSDSF